MTRKEGYQISGFEGFSYSIYFLGQNISFALPALYLVVFFTDIGIPAATVGIITLIVKVWDAVNDPIFGGIVDKVHLKRGKFMPWIRVSLIALPVTTILLFAIPNDMSLTAKIAWACIGYMLWDSAYTICDLPIFGLVTTLTNNVNERTAIMSYARIMALAAFIVATLIIPVVRGATGGWFTSAIALSVLTLLFMFPICVVGKERITPKPTADNFGFRDMFHYLGKNKYLLFFNLAIIVASLTNTSSALGIYIARYNMGNEAMLGLLTIAAIVPALVFGACLPALAKKFDKFHIFLFMFLLSPCLGVMFYFIGYENQTLFIIACFIRSIPSGAILFMSFMFTPDCVEYGLYRSGINASGIAFSIQTFTAKFSTAMATAVGAFALAVIGFVETEGALQAANFPDKLWVVFTLLPAAGSLAALPFLFNYKLRDKYAQIMAKANSGEITREEADKQLDGRFR
ncbi:MAG: glycoside-pentoside-hexuronide (GPH):cation symporter [Clostridiales Family XIII bacterium]|jgi:sugar (glycoside-pentoside-hexuronide) transporter|nr:glycoside-pentoside-hexuronide (GPH):cation symporter [Clostridiales Family XIII bacterium]